MSAADDQSLDELTRAAAKAILALENRLARLAAEAERQKTDLNTRRAAAQRDREEQDIEYSLSVGSQFVLEAPGTEEVRERERKLTADTIRAGGLQRQLSEFAALLGASARRFGAEGELLGGDEATQAAIRSGAIAAQELERQRLAREIHDGPAQALANAIVALEFVERAIRSAAPGSAERPLGEVERIKMSLREGLTEIRRFIFDLRPTMLQDRGLALTVEHYIATYQSAFSMAVELNAPPTLPRLTAEQELTAFRIVQEAIQNARKHARATRAVVSIAQTDSHLAVSITDDGRGFSPERVTSHVMGGAGLRGMRERSALIGAELLVDSTLGEGTTVELQIPLVSSATTDGEDPQFRTRSMPASATPDRRTHSAEVSTT